MIALKKKIDDDFGGVKSNFGNNFNSDQYEQEQFHELQDVIKPKSKRRQKNRGTALKWVSSNNFVPHSYGKKASELNDSNDII